MRVVRRTARAILLDGNGRLVVFRRTLPKRKPYWSTPGGGVDPEDDSIEAALHRELAEELGATVDRVQQVFLTDTPRGDGITVAHFFACRLVTMDLSLRTGEEFHNPAKGRYDVERIDLRGRKLGHYALQPPEVKQYILANRQALLATILDDSTPPLASPFVPTPVDATTADARPETHDTDTHMTDTQSSDTQDSEAEGNDTQGNDTQGNEDDGTEGDRPGRGDVEAGEAEQLGWWGRRRRRRRTRS